MPRKPTQSELLSFLLSYVRRNDSAKGMQKAAGVHFAVDQSTIYRWLGDLRQRREIGRGVFRTWRDAG